MTCEFCEQWWPCDGATDAEFGLVCCRCARELAHMRAREAELERLAARVYELAEVSK